MKQLHSAVGSENWLNYRNRVIGNFRTPAAPNVSRPSSRRALSSHGGRSPLHDIRLRIRANHPDQPFRLFDHEIHSIFFFDQSQ